MAGAVAVKCSACPPGGSSGGSPHVDPAACWEHEHCNLLTWLLSSLCTLLLLTVISKGTLFFSMAVFAAVNGLLASALNLPPCTGARLGGLTPGGACFWGGIVRQAVQK